MNFNRKGQGRGRLNGNRAGAGHGGNCLCPNCGHAAPHQQGIPCYNMKCPKCGSKMVRE